MSKIWIGEFGEFWLVVAGDDVIIVDIEPLKDGFVEFSPTRVGGLAVLLLGVAQNEQAAVEDGDEAVATHGGLGEDAFGGSALDGEPVLFAFEVFDTDGVGVVRFEELLGLVGDQAELAGSFGSGGVAFGEHGIDVLDDVGADAGELFVGAADGGPVGDDSFFDLIRLHGTEGAAVLSVLTAEAVKVVVLLTDPIAGALEGQWFSAIAAVQHTFQVVRVDAGLEPAGVTLLAHRLDSGEEFFADEWFVLSGVFGAVEGDDADVVAATQDRVDV